MRERGACRALRWKEAASEIVRVLDALERKERVVASGARHWIYLGDPAGIPYAPQIPADEVVRYRTA